MCSIVRVGAALALAAALTWAESPIRLKTRNLEPLKDLNDHLAGPLKRRAPNWSHYLLQFHESPGPGQMKEIRRRGGMVTGRVPETALMVAGPDDLNLEGLDVRWAGRLRYEDKLSPTLQATGEMLEMPATMGYVIEFHPDVNMAEARLLAEEHLLRVVENGDLIPHQLLVEGNYYQAAAMAEWDEVAYIFPASGDLREGVPVLGCRGATLAEGAVGQYVKVSQGWPSLTGDGVELGWVLQNSPASISVTVTRSEIERALAEWSQYTKLSFVPGSRAAKRTIDILFGRGNHGDPYPFDGPGRVLAHTFYPAPPNPESVAGDMHLDADENWQTGKAVDLYTVVLHELGHALGLGHSDRPGSVMYPYYRMASGLASDDIAGIRDIYGVRDPQEKPASPIPEDPPTTDPPREPAQPTAPQTPAGKPTQPDTVAPSLSITQPGSTMVSASAASIAMRGVASDKVGVVAVTWTNSAGSSGNADGTAFWSATVPLAIGRNAITIRAFDAAGNSSWRSVTVVRR